MTTAERIARHFGDTGTTWRDTEGRRIEDVCEELCVAVKEDLPVVVYRFPDGSRFKFLRGRWGVLR